MISNQEILRSLDNSEFVISYKVLDFRENHYGFFLKLRIEFIDQTILFTKEYFSVDVRNYSYHWQDKNNELLIRWDNTPFHKNIETFPHHKHKDNLILPSDEIGLEDVISFILKNLEEN